MNMLVRFHHDTSSPDEVSHESIENALSHSVIYDVLTDLAYDKSSVCHNLDHSLIYHVLVEGHEI